MNFSTQAATQATDSEPIPLPPSALEQGDYGFIGRDRAIHALERALRQQKQAGVLIHGMAGIGKTTLAQGFLQWLQQTGGLAEHVFWFRFDNIRSVEYLINQMIQGLFNTDGLALPLAQKLENLYHVFKKHAFIIVWDNFESASGIDGTEVTPLLSEDDRALLKQFLKQLRSGRTKVIITSRSSESWLPITECYRLPIGGLQGEACWQYCNAVVRDLGLALDRSDSTIQQLIEKLDGHPLAMRAVLLRLEHTKASDLLQQLQHGVVIDAQDDNAQQIYAALAMLETVFPPEYTAVLQCVGVHQRYMQKDLLTAMLEQSNIATDTLTLDACFNLLERAGLIHAEQKDLYSMHPALSGYLMQQHPAENKIQVAFVDYMGRLADHLAPKQLHEQRALFYYHGANFHTALRLAKTRVMPEDIAALTQSLAAFAQNNRDFQYAQHLYETLADHYLQQSNEKSLAITYHQLGSIAEEQRDFKQAEQWYLKSLAISEKQGNEHGAASTYAQLGLLKQLLEEWAVAAQWLTKAITAFTNSDDPHTAGRAIRDFISLLQNSDIQYHDAIKHHWHQAGLEQTISPLDELIAKMNNAQDT